MRKKYSLVLLFVIVILIVTLSLGYQKEYEYVEEQARLEEQRMLSVQGNAVKEQVFWLKARNGFVVVFLEDGESVYEYTDIRLTSLPENLQEEIRRGKRMVGIEKVYGFLENYTS